MATTDKRMWTLFKCLFFKILFLNVILSLQQGGKEYLMRAHFGLPSVEAEDKEGKPPISVKFEIPYFTTSGIQVKHLHPTPTTQT